MFYIYFICVLFLFCFSSCCVPYVAILSGFLIAPSVFFYVYLHHLIKYAILFYWLDGANEFYK